MDATASSILPELSRISLHAPRSAQMEETRTPETTESDQKLMERYRAGNATAFDEPQRRLSFCLGSTSYDVVLTITANGAQVSPTDYYKNSRKPLRMRQLP